MCVRQTHPNCDHYRPLARLYGWGSSELTLFGRAFVVRCRTDGLFARIFAIGPFGGRNPSARRASSLQFSKIVRTIASS